MGEHAALALEGLDLEADAPAALAQFPGQEAADGDAGRSQELGQATKGRGLPGAGARRNQESDGTLVQQVRCSAAAVRRSSSSR
jgi:hypothetical protein